MQYLVVFRPIDKFQTEGRPADFQEKELEEQAQVRVLYAGGGARQVWALETEARDSILGGVILFEARTPESLREMIESFPLVKANYAGYEILPLSPHAAFKPKP